MKANFIKATALVAFLCIFISVSQAQSYPSVSISIIDNTPDEPYWAYVSLFYLYNGVPTQVGSTITITDLYINSINARNLPWSLPVETEDNIYILVVQAYDNYNNPSYPPTAYSAWFNSPYYYSNLIPVTVRFP
jgi:Na+/H+ antiporter NhaB